MKLSNEKAVAVIVECQRVAAFRMVDDAIRALTTGTAADELSARRKLAAAHRAAQTHGFSRELDARLSPARLRRDVNSLLGHPPLLEAAE